MTNPPLKGEVARAARRMGDSKRRAKALLKAMSPAEVDLWLALRERPSALKFRTQHPSDPYVADFCCHEARLIVGVDGEAHGYGDRPARDEARDGWFAARGLPTPRIPARAVLQDCEAAVRGIVAFAAPRAKEQGY